MGYPSAVPLFPCFEHTKSIWKCTLLFYVAWGSLRSLLCVDFLGNNSAKSNAHTTFGNRSIAAAGPRLWNRLPATRRQMTSCGGQFGNTRKLIYFGPRNRSALWFCALQRRSLSYLLSCYRPFQWSKKSSRSGPFVHWICMSGSIFVRQ